MLLDDQALVEEERIDDNDRGGIGGVILSFCSSRFTELIEPELATLYRMYKRRGEGDKRLEHIVKAAQDGDCTVAYYTDNRSFTVCTLIANSRMYCGVSKCHTYQGKNQHDRFDSSVGRRKAFHRALQGASAAL